MKKETLVDVSDHVRILQKLNELYEKNPTKETAQSIIDYVDNEIPSQSLNPYVEERNFVRHLLFGAMFGAILNYFVMKYFGLEDSKMIGLSAWIALTALITYGMVRLENQSVESSIFRHYLKLKKMQYEQKKQDEIKALEDKYINTFTSADAPFKQLKE